MKNFWERFSLQRKKTMMKKDRNLLAIDGKVFAFNIDKIEKFINYSDKAISKETEILDSYDNGAIAGKTVRELTTPGNSQIDSIRYDLIKTFIIQLITYEGDFSDLETLPLGMKLAFNTMIAFGLLEEINL